MKQCCTCREHKALDQYTKDRHTKDGLNRRCKDCQSALNRGKRTGDTRTAVERFWGYVNRSGECWVWTRATSFHKEYPQRAYGVFTIDGRQQQCHRIAWRLTHGPIPDGLFVCHRCDNPLCVRPDHLFLGTPAENTADMIRKGRQPPRTAHRSRPKFTPEQVLEIVDLHFNHGHTRRALSKQYGVSYTAIEEIVKGESWADVTGLTLAPVASNPDRHDPYNAES